MFISLKILRMSDDVIMTYFGKCLVDVKQVTSPASSVLISSSPESRVSRSNSPLKKYDLRSKSFNYIPLEKKRSMQTPSPNKNRSTKSQLITISELPELRDLGSKSFDERKNSRKRLFKNHFES